MDEAKTLGSLDNQNRQREIFQARNEEGRILTTYIVVKPMWGINRERRIYKVWRDSIGTEMGLYRATGIIVMEQQSNEV